MAYTFSGGIHVEEYKNTRKCRIEALPPPAKVTIPLSQHIGAPAAACVNVGDTVTMGQKIGDVAEGMLGCPVHASVSGTVKEIVKKTLPTGAVVDHIVIENDMLDTVSPDLHPTEKRLADVTPEEIVSVIREAGIVGMGGAAFPTYAKINSAMGKVDKIIVNCAECEPFITANHRLLLEHGASVINGVKILLKALGGGGQQGGRRGEAGGASGGQPHDLREGHEDEISPGRRAPAGVRPDRGGDPRREAARRRGMRHFQRGNLRRHL